MKYLAVESCGNVRIVEADTFAEAVESITWKYEDTLVSMTKMPEEDK